MEGVAAGDAGDEAQGGWPVGTLSVVLRGGWPGARFGGRPTFRFSPALRFEEGMPAPVISPIMGDCGAGGHAGAGTGAGGGAAIGAGDHCGICTSTGAGVGEVTVCPQLGHGPVTPAICTGTVRIVRQKPHWNWIVSGFITSHYYGQFY